MKYVFYTVVLLPALTFGIFGDISTMPWVLIFIPLLFTKIKYEIVTLGFYLAFFSLISILIWGADVFLIAKSVIAILSATLIFPYVTKIDHREYVIAKKVLYAFIVLTIIVGILQFITPVARQLTEFAFGRASGFSEGKGVPGLSTEPARSAIDFIAVLVTLFYLDKNQIKNRHFQILIVAALVFSVFINRSNTVFIYILIYVGILFLRRFTLKNVFRAIVVGILVVILGYQLSNYLLGVHAVESAMNLLDSRDRVMFLTQLGGHRVVGLTVALNNITLFGNGLGGWYDAMESYLNTNFEMIKNIGFYRVVGLKPTPPMSFFGRYIIEFGLIGLGFYFYLLLENTKLARLKDFLKDPEPLFIIVILVILSYGGNPVPFLCLGLMYFKKYSNPFENYKLEYKSDQT
jgi:hypothetical protein